MIEQRLHEWFDGKLSDDELSDAEIRWLEQQVFSAISLKMKARSDVTYVKHQTLQ